MGTSIRTSIHKIGDGVVQFKDKNGTLMEFAVLDSDYFGSESQAIVELDLLKQGKSNITLRTEA